MNRERYDDNAFLRQKYFELCVELGEINNNLMDKVASLQNENKRLKAENWQLKHRKRK
ncbi:TPA: hypothetical protein ACTEI4_001674 [Streptococcus agalactiae]|uniref:hypothetical protein n=1 Tax=Streptococcus agalactiae TaxID=1311 RepID=UPI0014834600|nr:hypothetical protein [Streptococcus agalactiae]